MSVSNFDPKRISATEAARQHIRAQISRSGHRFLRLGVKESGCNGFKYTLDYLDQPTDQDEAFDIGDSVRLYVNQQDLPLVQGTEVDYVVEGLNASLKFRNPNAESHCGCGESFALTPEKH